MSGAWFGSNSRNVGSKSSGRLGRPSRKENLDDVVLDFDSNPTRILGEILYNISRKEGISKGKRLSYLNSFVKYLQQSKIQIRSGSTKLGFDTKDVCICLRPCLVHEATVIRIAAIRSLRYLINSVEDLNVAETAGIPLLIVRSLDLVLNNSGERMQAVRFCQKLLSIPSGAEHFPANLTRALVSIGFDGLVEHDKLHRSSLSVLCQLALLNPMHFIECGGVRVLLHNVLGCSSPMVLEAILGSLLHLLNVPATRNAAGINLQSLVAPLTDLHFKHTGYENTDKDVNERELGYRSAKVAIGTLLRSWSGLGNFCQSGLQALVDSLYIEQLEIRRTILDLICEIIGLKFPTWTDEVMVALSALDPSHPKDSWKLQEGFIVEEAITILPHLASTTPNITANHMALLILCFAQRGLLEALVEVIITSDTFISVRATVLLGELLSLVDHFLPLECFDPSQCIPSLIEHAMNPSFTSATAHNSVFSSPVTPQLKQQRAMEAITVLSTLHRIKAKTPQPSSVFLQMQVSSAEIHRSSKAGFHDRLGQVQLSRILKKDIENNSSKLLKETCVLTSKDPMTWQWEGICSVLKWCPEPLKRVDDSSWRTFLKRLVDFFKPSNNIFGRIELGHENASIFVKAGCFLLDFLAESIQNFSGKIFLDELVVDIAFHLDDILRHAQNPYSSNWNPPRLETTLTQTYFLFIGKLTQTPNGVKVLQKGEIFGRLKELIRNLSHEHYAKLIVSSLYYGEDECRRILSAILVCSHERARLYATQFLRILVRVKPPDFSKWGIELLVNQLEDKSAVISLSALDILEEAVHDKMFLESLIALRPPLTPLGDRGLLMLVCFVSLPSGFKFLLEANFLKNEILKWRAGFNKRYVELVEVLVRDSVSTLRRSEDGKYPERASKNQEQSKFVNIFVPPHLYGQLSQHKLGLEMLIEHGEIDNLIEVVVEQACSTAEETRELKAALWALGHFATSIDALPILQESNTFDVMVKLAKDCPVLSVRHTVFHCLCVISSTQPGAESLRRLGWYTMSRTHHETYPIWGTSSTVIPSTLSRLRDLDLDLSGDYTEDSVTSRYDASSDFAEENVNSSSFLKTLDYITEDVPSHLDNEGEMQANSHGDSILNHRRSRSNSLNLTSSASGIIPSGGGDVVDSANKNLNVPSEDARQRVSSMTSATDSGLASGSVNPSITTFGSWRMRKTHSDSVTESGIGVGSCESASEKPVISPSGLAEFTQTLSPIQSSASIATATTIRNSTPGSHAQLSQSFKDSTGTGLEDGWPPISPSYAYRTMIRKPVIRMPTSSDSDIYPHHSISPQRRMSLREFKSGSLDRHTHLTPMDLFNESKLRRVNTSMTSLSTPSFKSRKEPEAKGPCFMGLCLPRELEMLFLAGSVHTPVTHVSLSSKSDQRVAGSRKDVSGWASFQFHSGVSSCLACNSAEAVPPKSLDNPKSGASVLSIRTNSLGLENKTDPSAVSEAKTIVHEEILRLVSSMISCIGVKSNEQSLLRLKQKFPRAFQDLCLYSELIGLISQYNVRVPLRRFLQELFYDLSYDEFYDAALSVTETYRQNNSEVHSLLNEDKHFIMKSTIKEQAEVLKHDSDSDYVDLK